MKEKIKGYLPYIIIILVVILVRSFIVSPARVDGDSMESTLWDGDIVLVNKMNLDEEGLNRFDIVVVKQKKDLLIKRIIGLPGERVAYKDGILHINGRVVTPAVEFEYTEDFEGAAASNEYYVLGDNRDDSKDSRYFGAVKMKDIKGTVGFRLFPFKNLGKVE